MAKATHHTAHSVGGTGEQVSNLGTAAMEVTSTNHPTQSAVDCMEKLRVDEHEASETVRDDDKLGLDILFNTMVSLYDHQTAESYMEHVREVTSTNHPTQSAEDHVQKSVQALQLKVDEHEPPDTMVSLYDHQRTMCSTP